MLSIIAQSSLGQLKPPTTAFSEGSDTGLNAANNLEGFISAMIGFLTILAGVFFIFYFLLGAFKWLTSGGDSGQVQKARNQITQGVIGLILIIAAYSVIGLIGSVIGLNLLNPGTEIINLILLQ